MPADILYHETKVALVSLIVGMRWAAVGGNPTTWRLDNEITDARRIVESVDEQVSQR